MLWKISIKIVIVQHYYYREDGVAELAFRKHIYKAKGNALKFFYLFKMLGFAMLYIALKILKIQTIERKEIKFEMLKK